MSVALGARLRREDHDKLTSLLRLLKLLMAVVPLLGIGEVQRHLRGLLVRSTRRYSASMTRARGSHVRPIVQVANNV